MSDLQGGMVARADELIKALMPGDAIQGSDAELRANLSELVNHCLPCLAVDRPSVGSDPDPSLPATVLTLTDRPFPIRPLVWHNALRPHRFGHDRTHGTGTVGVKWGSGQQDQVDSLRVRE